MSACGGIIDGSMVFKHDNCVDVMVPVGQAVRIMPKKSK